MIHNASVFNDKLVFTVFKCAIAVITFSIYEQEEKKTLRSILDKIIEGQEPDKHEQNPEKSDKTEGGVA